MTITVEGLLYEYMTVVRANGQDAIGNVGSVNPEDPEEIMWEVIETYENTNEALVDSDPIWPLARLAAQMAITICHQQVSEVVQ